MHENLPGQGALPFVAIITPDLKWVGGFSGYRDANGVANLLDSAEKTTLMNASPEDAKKLEALATQAEQAIEKSLWPKAVAAGRAAAALNGRSPFRTRIAAAVAKARAYADGEMTKALDAVKAGGDRAAARASLKRLSAAFAGEPEAKEADAGVKAFDRVGVLADIAPEQKDAAREKAMKDFAGTRWTALFAPATPDKK